MSAASPLLPSRFYAFAAMLLLTLGAGDIGNLPNLLAQGGEGAA